MSTTPDPAALFTPIRPALIGLAYRMTGSIATAEDIAQDAFLRWQAADRTTIAVPRAWLLKAATRLSLDHLKSARTRRERYVGPWLPEPVVDDDRPPQEATQETTEDVSNAFLLVLQRLGPVERAVFVLHDLFDTPFAEIATLLGRSEAACRQLASRARAHVRAGTPRHDVPPAEAQAIARAFLAASRDGDEAALRQLLAADVVLHTDGGGVRPSALNLVEGADRVSRFFAGIARKRPAAPILLHLGRINAAPGFVTREPDGLPQTTALEMGKNGIVAIHIVRNPDKLWYVQVQLLRIETYRSTTSDLI